jgi:dihydrofolate synthase/folylpolyglutamate synthase
MSAATTAMDWLLSFSDPKRGVGWNRASRGGLEANLRRTRVLLDLAGAPDRRMLVVLVAGTKGKGSTAAMLASVLAASGVRAGLSTKPHLQSFRERVRVDGVAISESQLATRIDELRPLVEQLRDRLPRAGAPTTFELTTVLALAHYAQERCSVAVVEVGLGGRYDATNATDPHVSVITAISHDHTRELGARVRDIAAEKAGIVRPGRVVVVAPQTDEARAVIRRASRDAAAELREVRPIAARTALALRGAHQRANAAAALEAARALSEHGVAFDNEAAERALATVRWPGRFEVLDGSPPIVLDAAHNDGSAEALAHALRESFPRRRIRFVLGVMADKDARAVIRPLLPLASAVEATRAPSPRGLDPRQLARLVRGVPTGLHDNVAGAIAAARAAAQPREIVCVTGSFALVGSARDVLGLAVAERLWDSP